MILKKIMKSEIYFRFSYKVLLLLKKLHYIFLQILHVIAGKFVVVVFQKVKRTKPKMKPFNTFF